MTTTTCPHHKNKVRPDLPPLTDKIAALPVDERGYPVPFFVAWIDGKPDFRIADPAKIVRCNKEKLCWTCGQSLGRYMAFPIGPMCAINRTTAEPPNHLSCAEWSVRGCPFLSRPKMVRREDELTETHERNVAGIMIKRNPGVICLWVTRDYKIFRDPAGRPLFEIGEPTAITWWREGRHATRAEVQEGIDTGLPALVEVCRGNEKELAELRKHVERAMVLLPPHDKISPVPVQP